MCEIFTGILEICNNNHNLTLWQDSVTSSKRSTPSQGLLKLTKFDVSCYSFLVTPSLNAILLKLPVSLPFLSIPTIINEHSFEFLGFRYLYTLEGSPSTIGLKDLICLKKKQIFAIWTTKIQQVSFFLHDPLVNLTLHSTFFLLTSQRFKKTIKENQITWY